MQQALILTLLLCLLALLSPMSWQPASAACNSFDRVDGASDCVRPEFYRVLSGLCGTEPCALACAPLASCQAFAPLPRCQCKLFLFDACSHRVQSVRDGCSVRTTVYVRRLSGAARGRLCPAGFGNGSWYGTSYKVVTSSPAKWSDAMSTCSAAGGLAKFADALDANETVWLQSIRSISVIYFLGGYQTTASSDLKANWIWDACNVTFDRSLWRSSEPNGGQPNQGCFALYAYTTVGIDDFSCNDALGYICECQSVFN